MAGDFPAPGRQIYVAYEWQWDALELLVNRMGWMLCLIPGTDDPAGPGRDGIPTYCLQLKGEAP